MKRLTIILMLILMITGCSQVVEEQADMSAYEQLTEKHHYIEKDYDKIVSDLKAKKSGIYFIGYPDIEASKDLILVLNTVLNETHETAYYIDTRSEQFTIEIHKKYLEFESSLDDYLQSNGAMPFIVIINKKGIAIVTPKVDGVALGTGHISNVARNAIKEELKAIISNDE